MSFSKRMNLIIIAGREKWLNTSNLETSNASMSLSGFRFCQPTLLFGFLAV
jgi:hypothetical protein